VKALDRRLGLLGGFVLALIGGQTLSALGISAPRIEGDFTYRLELEPDLPSIGQALSLSVVITDLGGASLASARLGDGLSLVSSSSHALVSERGERGSEILLEFATSKSGPHEIEELVFEGREGRLRLGPFAIVLKGGVATAPPSWTWVYPTTVTVHQSFAIALETKGRIPEVAWPVFDPPEGIFLEAGPKAFTWVATALRPGSLQLPSVEIRSPSTEDRGGRAAAVEIAVAVLPASLAESRAIGNFGLSIEGPKQGRVGRPLELRVKLEGRGNLPSLRLPDPIPSLDGRGLPRGSWSERREDDIGIGKGSEAGTYRGSVSLLLTYMPDSPGLFSLRLSPYRVMDEAGRLVSLEAKPFSLQIAAGEGNKTSLDEGRGGTGGGGNAVTVPARGTEATVPGGGASTVTSRADVSIATTVPRDGKELAALYHRARIQDPSLRKAARGQATQLGLPPPDFGPWPPALPLALAAGLALLGFLLLLVFRRRLSPGAGFVPALVLVLGLLSATGAVLAAMDRGRERALVWTDRLLTIPSEEAQSSLGGVRGASARVLGKSEGWTCVLLRDGRSGWLPDEALFFW